MMINGNLKELVLGKAQGAVIKCLKPLPPDLSWNNVKALLQQMFSLVPMVTHVFTHLMHRYKQKGDILQEFNFELS